MKEAMIEGKVQVAGQQLVYSEFGSGDRVVVLSPTLLTSRRLQENWAAALAERGFRVIALDMLGETPDGLPLTIDHYDSEALGKQLLAVLDRLGIERAVLGGTALGANISLEVAAAAPERVVGLILEGPFLEDGIGAYVFASSLILAFFSVGKPFVWLGKQAARLIPADRPGMLGQLRDVLTAPVDRSRAFLHGLVVGRMAPPKQVRVAVTTPALILSLKGDPFHPASDAQQLHSEIPGAQLLRVGTLLTLRLRPKRATPAIISFLNEVFGQDYADRLNK